MKVYKKFQGYLATTHVDLHGHRFSKEELEQILYQATQKPFFYRNHRTDNPPVGKVIEAKLTQLNDGEYGILATIEIYDERTSQEIESGALKGFSVTVSNKEIKLNNKKRLSMAENTLILAFNRQSYDEKDVDRFINETSHIVQIEKQPLIMLAETGPVLITLVILSPLFYFMKGFFTKMGETLGEDTYRFFKEKLINLLRSNITEGTPTLDFRLKIEGTNVEIRGAVTFNDTNTMALALNSIKELYDLAVDKITEIQVSSNDQIRIISYKFNPDKKSWDFSFAQTDSLKVIK